MITALQTQCIDINIVSTAINQQKLSAEINANNFIKGKSDFEIVNALTVVNLDDIELLTTQVFSYYVRVCILICDKKNSSVPSKLKDYFDSVIIVCSKDAYQVTSNLVYFMHGLSTLVGLDLADINCFFKSSGDVKAVIGKRNSIQRAFNEAKRQFSDELIAKATHAFFSFTHSADFTYSKMEKACATLSKQLPKEADFGFAILGLRKDEDENSNDVMLILSV